MSHQNVRQLHEVVEDMLEAGSGAPVALPRGRRPLRVSVGPAEVYLQTPQFRTLLAVVPGGGFVFPLSDSGDTVLAVSGAPGTTLTPISVPQNEASASRIDMGLVAGAESWVDALLTALAQFIGERPVGRWIRAGDLETLAAGETVASERGAVWLKPPTGTSFRVGSHEFAVDAAFPVTARLGISTTQDTETATLTTDELAKAGLLRDAMVAFNTVVPSLVASLRLERDRADLERISVNTGPTQEPRRDRIVSAAADAIAALGAELGVTPVGPLRIRSGDFTELAVLLRQAGMRARRVTLPPRWWRSGQGRLLAIDPATSEAVALSWRGWAYEKISGDARRRITRRNASQIGANAYEVYAPLPADVTGFVSLARRLLPGVARDGAWAIAAGGALGLMGVLAPMGAGWVLSDIVPSRAPGLLFAVGLALVTAALFSLLFSAARGLALSRVAGRTGIEVAAAVADRVLRLHPGFFKEHAAGDLEQRIGAIDEMRHLITTVLISALITLAFSLFYLVLLIAYDLKLALISLGIVAVYVVAVSVARIAQIRHLRRAAELQGKSAGATYETLAGIIKLRVAAAEDRALARWLSIYAGEQRAYFSIDRITKRFEAFSDAYQTITLAFLFAAAALLVRQDLSAGIFIGFLLAFAAFQGAFTGFCNSLLSVFAAAPMVERARPLLTTPGETSAGRADPGPLAGAIEVSGLTFGYQKGGKPVLDGLDLCVHAGEHVAIVGASGSGKSTLLRLLLGFEDPERGSITYDGQDLAKLDLSRVRSQIGVVMQSSRLFAGTIYENIRGAGDAGLSECLQAAERAGLAPDLRDMPMGLHTPTVEGANTLSGGQKQRILIARALASHPTMIFFDEATSALDNATQARVTKTLDVLGATRITVAHRLSTVGAADRIHVLADRRFVESGTFEELMALDGHFAVLAKRQLTKE